MYVVLTARSICFFDLLANYVGVLLSVHSTSPQYLGTAQVGPVPHLLRFRERAAAQSRQMARRSTRPRWP